MATEKLRETDAGREALTALEDLFSAPALDTDAQHQVRSLIHHYYTGLAGSVLDAVREAVYSQQD